MNEDSNELKKIYEANKKIELFHELKANPPISGSIAKRLLNNCHRALKIISKYDTEMEDELRREIEVMEDQLANDGIIRTITYNLGARTFIHVSIDFADKWVLK
ncbi:hypothetical protein LCGC14_1569820 [marine sediment metagenome]|uniref:Uncharacterized protein n=1 Tax=marine sediment metagenome TaxID=412755 RepID=A0A0F9LKG7_9ZZZZ|nr:hypothetical protein [bacterium]